MPKVIYRGPTHELVVGEKTLIRDGDAVELTADEVIVAQGASLDTVIEVAGGPTAPPVQVQPVVPKVEGN